jgi:hypothetical protein
MGGNISRDPPASSGSNNSSRKIKPGYRNNSKAHTTASAAATAVANSQQQEKKQILLQQQPKPTKRTIYGRTYHAVDTSTYMLPRDDKEIDRLHDEHFITKELLGLYVF